jgi:peptide/nickel transport system substrate-binding protein
MTAVRPAVAVALALAAGLPAPAAGGVRPATGGTIRIGLPSAARLAPAGAPTIADRVAERATAAPLLELDPRGALVPGALSEVPAPEAGGRAFRLRLRPGLTDHAGRPIEAADVAARLESLLAPGEAAPHAWVAIPILGADAVLEGRAPLLAGVQVLSPAELLVTLAFPLPEFPWLLAALPAALRDAGPFQPAPGRASSQPLLLLANGRHHLGRPFAEALELRPADPRGAARDLDEGRLDLVLRPEAASGRGGPALAPMTVTVAALGAARLGPAAEGVRRALGALDRADLARRFVRGPAVPLATIVPPAILPGAPPPSAPATAPAGPAPRLVLLADASAPDQRALAGRIQVKLFDAGIRASVELADGPRLAARLASGDYDVALVPVPVEPFRPALAAGQIAFAVRGAAAARRALAALAGLDGEAALAAADRLGRELDLVPLVASGIRASPSAALQGLAPGADGGFDPGALWLLGGAAAGGAR